MYHRELKTKKQRKESNTENKTRNRMQVKIKLDESESESALDTKSPLTHFHTNAYFITITMFIGIFFGAYSQTTQK